MLVVRARWGCTGVADWVVTVCNVLQRYGQLTSLSCRSDLVLMNLAWPRKRESNKPTASVSVVFSWQITLAQSDVSGTAAAASAGPERDPLPELLKPVQDNRDVDRSARALSVGFDDQETPIDR